MKQCICNWYGESGFMTCFQSYGSLQSMRKAAEYPCHIEYRALICAKTILGRASSWSLDILPGVRWAKPFIKSMKVVFRRLRQNCIHATWSSGLRQSLLWKARRDVAVYLWLCKSFQLTIVDQQERMWVLCGVIEESFERIFNVSDKIQCQWLVTSLGWHSGFEHENTWSKYVA